MRLIGFLLGTIYQFLKKFFTDKCDSGVVAAGLDQIQRGGGGVLIHKVFHLIHDLHLEIRSKLAVEVLLQNCKNFFSIVPHYLKFRFIIKYLLIDGTFQHSTFGATTTIKFCE